MRIRFYWNCLAFFIALAATPAHAITFATGSGADSAGCGAVTSPCRTLQQAVTNAPAAGYVVLQGPADFGRATVDKSLTIVGEGGATLDGAGAPSNKAVIEVWAGASDIVRLRGLTILNAPLGGAGVFSGRAKSLEIVNCFIRQNPPAAPSFRGAGVMPMWLDGGQLVVLDTTIEAPRGVLAGSNNQPIKSYLSGLRITASDAGVWMGTGLSLSPSTVMVDSSVNNAPTGLLSVSGELIARNVSISNGANALRPYGGVIYLSRSTITGNAKVIEQFSYGAVSTFGDNAIRGNADDSLPRTQTATYH